jgi:hypothetical protein
VEEYQKVVDAEWNILYDKLDRIAKSGAKVVLSKLPIGDVATQVLLLVLVIVAWFLKISFCKLSQKSHREKKR